MFIPLGLHILLSVLFASFTVSRSKMFHVELFLIGVCLAFTTIILICLLFGLFLEDFSQGMLLTISIVLCVILIESFSDLSPSSAAPPACLDGFTVETNGGTGEAYTCTPLHP